jgi:hypothetical protein
MDQTTNSESAPFELAPRPSLIGRFFSGLTSGAFNGLLIMGIFSAVTLGLHVVFPLSIGFELALLPFVAGVATTSLFSGVMAVKRALEEPSKSPAMRDSELASTVMVPTIAGPMMQPAVEMVEEAPATASTKWTEQVGRGNSQNQIQKILTDGALSDKARASAILEQRQATAGNSASVA